MPKMNRDVRNFSYKDLDLVHHLVEKCLLLYMKPAEVVNTLFHRAKIEPVVTERILERLEQMNPQFFRAYRMRLTVKDQILRFNQLLEEQVEVMRDTQMSQIRAVPSTLANGFQSHSMNYSAYQDQTHVVPSVASGNSQNMMNAMPNYYAAGESSHQASVRNVVGMRNVMPNYYAAGESSQQASMRNVVGMRNAMPNYYAAGESSQQASMRNAVGMRNAMPNYYAAGESSQQASMRSAVGMRNAMPNYYAAGESSQQASMRNAVGMRNMPNYYSAAASSQQASMRYAVGMQGHTGLVDMQANMPLNQGSNAGIMNAFNGVDSQVMFGQDNGLLQPDSNGNTEASFPPHSGGVGNHGIPEASFPPYSGRVENHRITEASIPTHSGGVGNDSITEALATPYTGGQSKSLTFCQAMLAIETNLLGNSGQMNQISSLSDSTNGFNSCNGTLGNYSSSPLVGNNALFIPPQQGIRISQPTSDIFGYEGFHNDGFSNEGFHSQ